ncbi:MAG TPA: CAP domain-containing protein [Patescibacteria group bacterium]
MKKFPQFFSILILLCAVLLVFLYRPHKPEWATVSANNVVSTTEKPNKLTPPKTETKAIEASAQVIPEQVTPPPVVSQSASKNNNPAKTIKRKVVTPPSVPPKPTPVTVPSPSLISCNTGDLSTQFLCLMNNYRLSNGLNALSYDSALTAVASEHSTWMNATATLSHIGENGSKFYQRCQAGLTTCDAENVARGYTTAPKLFEAWRVSPDHNANILGSHTKMGLSLVGSYATNIFR